MLTVIATPSTLTRAARQAADRTRNQAIKAIKAIKAAINPKTIDTQWKINLASSRKKLLYSSSEHRQNIS